MVKTKIPFLFAIFALSISYADGEVGSISFQELVRKSDLIVVAKVESLTHTPKGKEYASAVTEVWKGAPSDNVKFLSSSTWACDISEAVKGETVLLFLIWDDDSRSYVIAHAGRGRMPLRTVLGKRYATFWEDNILLPKETATIAGPDKDAAFIRSVEVAVLREFVRDALRAAPPRKA